MKTLLDREDLMFNPVELGCVLSLTGLPGGSNKIHDRSPYGNTGTITGASWVRLPSGLWCLSFDGMDDFVDCGDEAGLSPTGAITLEAWVKATSYQADSTVMEKRESSFGYQIIYQSSTAKLGFNVREDGSSHWARVDTNPTTDTWFHIVGTYDKAEVKIYLNAHQQTETANFTGSLSHTANNLWIGRARYGATPCWQGHIALPRIYSRALSALEIQNHFYGEKHLFGGW